MYSLMHNEIPQMLIRNMRQPSMRSDILSLWYYLSDDRVTGVLSSPVSMASSVSLVFVDRRRLIFSTTSKEEKVMSMSGMATLSRHSVQEANRTEI